MIQPEALWMSQIRKPLMLPQCQTLWLQRKCRRLFCGNDRTTLPQNPVKLKYVAGQAAEFGFAGAGSRGSIPFAGVHRDGIPCEGGVPVVPFAFNTR